MKLEQLLIAAAMTAVAGSAQAAVTDISFDGFCDGMKLTTSRPGGTGTPRIAAETATGCITDIGLGFVVKVIDDTLSRRLHIGTHAGTTCEYVYLIQYPLVQGGAWSNYYTCDGTTAILLNTGTYSLGAPAAPAEARAKKSSDHR